MAIIQYPGTNFHDLNLDWVLEQVKNLLTEWGETRTDWENLLADNTEFKSTLENEWDSFHDYIISHIDEDVPSEVVAEIDRMANDGRLLALITEDDGEGSALSDVVGDWLAAHITQETGYVIDDTLKVEGAAADAKATGNAVAELKGAIQYNKTRTKNILDLSNVVYGSVNSSGQIVSNAAYSTQNFIPVEAGKTYISSVDGVTNLTASRLLVVAFYSSEDETSYISRLTNVQSFTVPTGATYVRFSSAAINTDNLVVGFYPKAQIEEGTVPTPFVPPFELAHVAVPYNAITDGAYSSPSAVRPIGHTKIPYFDTEYSQIICYGQSLSVGADSLYVQDSVIPGCYALGTLTSPSATFNQLQLASNGQHPIVSAVNSLHTLLTSNGLYAPNMVAGSYGAGGQSIAQLMSATRQAQIKSEEEYDYDITTENKYQTFLDSLTAMKTAVGDHSVCCPVIVFLQGERDYYSDEELSNLQPGSSVHAYACGDDKDKYKKYMGWLKDDMQNACVSVLGQSKKPLFVIYQVSGNFVKKHDLGINMAQQEFAEENKDVILLPAPYFTPNYGSAHLATNGYRWLGEYIAEAVFQMSVQRSKYQPLIARDIRIEGNKVVISTSGATLPLKLDAYTVEQTSENGFRLWRDGTKYTVLSVSFRGDEIVLTTGSSIDLNKAGSVVEVSYAGSEVGGTGNVRDSAQYGAMYSYWDDTNDTGASGSLSVNYRPIDSAGNSMVGKPYPMFNWLSPFYWTATNPS